MVRRIALPSADELFGDKKSSSPRAKTTSKTQKTASRPASSAPKRITPKVGGAAPKPQRAAKPRGAAARLSGLESHLSTMPVDALIDLRDGIEDLLAADTLDEAAVRRFLDGVGA